jgi:basic amino acid/polyamine antiporter, APA family
LLRLHHRRVRSPGPHVSVPVWFPAAGLVTCLIMIASAFLK